MFDLIARIPDTFIAFWLGASTVTTLVYFVFPLIEKIMEDREYKQLVATAKRYADVMGVPEHEALNRFNVQPRW